MAPQQPANISDKTRWRPDKARLLIKPTTKNRLAKWGAFGESWDDVLNRLLDVFEDLEMEPHTLGTSIKWEEE